MVLGSRGEHEAQARFGTVKRARTFYQTQRLDYLNPAMREFIARQEMVFLATSDATGACDSSFRAGPPGFVQVLDDRTVAYPEYRGNGVLASIGNLLDNAQIGMLFVDFLSSTVGLHVNGRARVMTPTEFAAQGATASGGAGRSPYRGPAEKCWVLVHVEEAYIHCSKHIPRLQRVEKAIHWGTDEEAHKGGDYFNAKGCPRPWSQRDSGADGGVGDR